MSDSDVEDVRGQESKKTSKEDWDRRIQEHHDHYVKLKLTGRLHPQDLGHYELAMQREREGLVQPLRS